jgi:small subunit ribosomal protein S21
VAEVTELLVGEEDRLEWALKKFRKLVERSGVLRDLRKHRHYVKPSKARRLKEAEAKRRKRADVRRAKRRDERSR